MAGPAVAASAAPAVVDLGGRRELFVDDFLVERMNGAEWRLHAPIDRGPALKPGDVPWEDTNTGYGTVIKDGGTYRLYYRGNASMTNGRYCYAESPDGVVWTKPNLGLHEFAGSKANNIILAGRAGSHSFSPFLDANPAASPDQRYKALGLLRTADDKRWELLAFVSADGIRWRLLREQPVMTEGAFDSQNVSFWSVAEKKYVCYYRTKSGGATGLRQISRATSDDFVRWGKGETMAYRRLGETAPMEQMYINQTHPYFRAPHLYIATAARFMQGRRAVSEEDAATFGKANFADCSDAVLMSTRGDQFYDRTFLEGWVRPGPGFENWSTRSNYPLLGIVPTGPNEMSLFVTKEYALPSVHIRRYTLRLDGFASVHAPYAGGEMITKPLTLSGGRLVLNYATSAAGSVRVELQTAAGNPISGFSLADCPEIIGDRIEHIVRWKGGADLSAWAGQPIRLRFAMKDADLYSIRFSSEEYR
ncbi:MAG: hypothetical protein EXS32_05570 [Opitutus sp.]|nr:hypothetical protein [Opitutus sp.]